MKGFGIPLAAIWRIHGHSNNGARWDGGEGGI